MIGPRPRHHSQSLVGAALDAIILPKLDTALSVGWPVCKPTGTGEIPVVYLSMTYIDFRVWTFVLQIVAGEFVRVLRVDTYGDAELRTARTKAGGINMYLR